MDVLHSVYWVMAVVGTLVTVALLFFGGDHDVSDADIGVEHFDLGHHGDGGPGPLSLRTILAFVGGWGWGGLIGVDILGWGFLSAPFGLLVGLLLAVVVFRFSRFLFSQEATSSVNTAHLIGIEGVVLTAIPSSGTGEIRLYIRGTPLKSLARSESGEAIAEGKRIIVVEELGGTLLVRPIGA